MLFKGVEHVPGQLGGEVACDKIDLFPATKNRLFSVVRTGNSARWLAPAAPLGPAAIPAGWVEGKNDRVLLGRLAAQTVYTHFN